MDPITWLVLVAVLLALSIWGIRKLIEDARLANILTVAAVAIAVVVVSNAFGVFGACRRGPDTRHVVNAPGDGR